MKSLGSTPSFMEIQVFIAVFEARSFTKAAKLLRLSPARVSEIIRGVEERIGVRLMERTTRSVSATSAGDHLYAKLSPILQNYSEAIDSLNDFRENPTGSLRLTVPPPAADFVLAPIIAKFLQQYPGICLEISVERAFVDIIEGRFDAGIRPGNRVENDMIAVRISDPLPFIVAAAPSYLKSRGVPQSYGELTNHACIRVRHPGGIPVPWRFSQDDHVVDVEGPLVVNEPGIAIAGAIGGVGLIQLPEVYLRSALETGTLVQVLENSPGPRIDALHLYYSSRRQMRLPLKILIAFLKNEYRHYRK